VTEPERPRVSVDREALEQLVQHAYDHAAGPSQKGLAATAHLEAGQQFDPTVEALVEALAIRRHD